MADRLEFRRSVKTAAWERCGGKCECCAKAFEDGERVEFDHRIPDALRKNNSLDNCQVLCAGCHGEKTKGDVTTIARAKRIERKHNGTFRPPRNIVPGSRASRFKKKLNGKVEFRQKENTNV